MKMKKFVLPILLLTTLTACGGGSGGDDGKNTTNTSTNNSGSQTSNSNENAPFISGQIQAKPSFKIPCDALKADLFIAAAANRDYEQVSLESESSGILFKVVLPTRLSLYQNALGTYKPLAYSNFSTPNTLQAADRFGLSLKVPYGDSKGELYYTSSNEISDSHYTKLVSIIEESKADGKAVVLLRFKFNHKMAYTKDTIQQANVELNNGELLIRVTVANK